jgi:hypothetical protein
MSKSHKGKHGKPMWLNTPEQIERSKKRMAGNKFSRLRKKENIVPVISISPEGIVTEYESIKKAAQLNDTTPTSIYRACSKQRKTCKGLTWEYKSLT